jgi:hypothetical protein
MLPLWSEFRNLVTLVIEDLISSLCGYFCHFGIVGIVELHLSLWS